MTRQGRVDKILKPGGACHHLGLYASHGDILKLLDAEHRAVVRLVQRLRAKAGIRTQYQRERETKANVISAYTLACDDILRALEKRKGG